jgi:hypothetical protein
MSPSPFDEEQDPLVAGMTWRSARRAILAVAVALLIPFAVLVVKGARAHQAVDRITGRGGLVTSSSEIPGLGWMPRQIRWPLQRFYVARESYKVRIGDWFVGCSTGLTLQAWDEDHRTPEGDWTLAALPDLGNIAVLEVRKAAVTDQGLRHVGALSRLTSLTLEQTAVTGAGFGYLRGLPLKNASFEGSPVDDAGLAALSSFPALETLSLAGTRVTGAGLSDLGRFRTLNALDLSRTSVDDEGLRHLTALRLTALWLTDTAVSDAGLAHLERLTGLTSLRLCRSRVSKAAVARSSSEAVRQSLDGCR